MGYPPFESSDQRMTLKKIKENEFYFPSQITLSFQAKDFISRILVTDPNKRPSIYDILDHPFIINTQHALKIVTDNILNSPNSQDSIK